jgi:hypothetical protein
VLAGRYTSYTIWPQNTAVIHWQKEQNICLNKQKLKSQWSFIVARTEFVKKYAKIKKTVVFSGERVHRIFFK